MKTVGGNASSNAAIAVVTALFEHLIKSCAVTPEAKSEIIADAIKLLDNAENNTTWIRGAKEVVDGIEADLAKS